MDHGKASGNGTARRNDSVRLVLLSLGILLIILTPFVGALPGPGGIITLATGLALALKNSNWAKRLYVRFKQRWPKYGRIADWSLRRRSYFRRLRRRKEEAGEDEDLATGD